VAEAIKKLKYSRRMDILPVMQHWLTRPACRELVDAAEVLVPVPLHTRRLKERGFNQAVLLAQAFPEKPLARETLVRVRHTPPQTGLNPKERRENVRKAFAVPRPEEVKGKTILLVDDVYTTGATVRECAKVLLKAGAREVNVLTVARVRHD
jgi:ComF family protein